MAVQDAQDAVALQLEADSLPVVTNPKITALPAVIVGPPEGGERGTLGTFEVELSVWLVHPQNSDADGWMLDTLDRCLTACVRGGWPVTFLRTTYAHPDGELPAYQLTVTTHH